jgi:hypothetical protein
MGDLGSDNPFGPVFRSAADQIVVWAAALVFTALSASSARGFELAGERRLQGASGAFLKMASGTLATFALGVIGGLSGISSALWIIWQLAFLISTVAVFWVLPVLLLALFFWALRGNRCGPYHRRAFENLLLGLVLEVGSAGAYFATCKIMREHG